MTTNTGRRGENIHPTQSTETRSPQVSAYISSEGLARPDTTRRPVARRRLWTPWGQPHGETHLWVHPAAATAQLGGAATKQRRWPDGAVWWSPPCASRLLHMRPHQGVPMRTCDGQPAMRAPFVRAVLGFAIPRQTLLHNLVNFASQPCELYFTTLWTLLHNLVNFTSQPCEIP